MIIIHYIFNLFKFDNINLIKFAYPFKNLVHLYIRDRGLSPIILILIYVIEVRVLINFFL